MISDQMIGPLRLTRDPVELLREARAGHHTTIVDVPARPEEKYSWQCECGSGRSPRASTDWDTAMWEKDRHEAAVIVAVISNALAPEETAWFDTIMDQRDKAIEERKLLRDDLQAWKETSDIHMNAANNMRPVVEAAMRWQDKLVADHPGGEGVVFTDELLPLLLQALYAYRKTLEEDQ